MKTKFSNQTAVFLLAAGLLAPTAVVQAQETNGLTARTANHGEADKIIAQWPARPKLGAEMMLSKYGAPQEITSEKLVWLNPGQYKRITVTKREDHHDFPKPHTDFLEHTVSYYVPTDKVEDLAEFDGSVTFDRTRGELSARCDLESHNLLSLNLANDIINGKEDAASARRTFSKIIVEEELGKNPTYVTALQFQPATTTAFVDKPTISGSPVRPIAKNANPVNQTEGEVLGFMTAINENEIQAATVAHQKKLNPAVADYATMLHEEHGQNLDQTLKLGQKIDIKPLETPAVDALRVKGATELATLVPFDGPQFETAFTDAMVRGHNDALQLIDQQLMPKVKDDSLRQQLAELRHHVVAHLQAAQQIQASLGFRATSVPVRSQQ